MPVCLPNFLPTEWSLCVVGGGGSCKLYWLCWGWKLFLQFFSPSASLASLCTQQCLPCSCCCRCGTCLHHPQSYLVGLDSKPNVWPPPRVVFRPSYRYSQRAQRLFHALVRSAVTSTPHLSVSARLACHQVGSMCLVHHGVGSLSNAVAVPPAQTITGMCIEAALHRRQETDQPGMQSDWNRLAECTSSAAAFFLSLLTLACVCVIICLLSLLSQGVFTSPRTCPCLNLWSLPVPRCTSHPLFVGAFLCDTHVTPKQILWPHLPHLTFWLSLGVC